MTTAPRRPPLDFKIEISVVPAAPIKTETGGDQTVSVPATWQEQYLPLPPPINEHDPKVLSRTAALAQATIAVAAAAAEATVMVTERTILSRDLAISHIRQIQNLLSMKK